MVTIILAKSIIEEVAKNLLIKIVVYHSIYHSRESNNPPYGVCSDFCFIKKKSDSKVTSILFYGDCPWRSNNAAPFQQSVCPGHLPHPRAFPGYFDLFFLSS